MTHLKELEAENAYVERFNRTVQEDVQNCKTAWPYFYNHERPHTSVDGRPLNFKQ